MFRNVLNLILPIKDKAPKEFEIFKILDNNINELLARVVKLEARNMRYYCRAYRATDQSIPDNTNTFINFTNTDYPQFGNMHDNTNNNDGIYIRRTGVYYLGGAVVFASSAGGGSRLLAIDIIRGGTTFSPVAPTIQVTPAGTQRLNCFTAYYLYVDDIVKLRVLQTSGGPLDVLFSGTDTPHLVVSERMEDLSPDQYGLLNPEANMR